MNAQERALYIYNRRRKLGMTYHGAIQERKEATLAKIIELKAAGLLQTTLEENSEAN